MGQFAAVQRVVGERREVESIRAAVAGESGLGCALGDFPQQSGAGPGVALRVNGGFVKPDAAAEQVGPELVGVGGADRPAVFLKQRVRRFPQHRAVAEPGQLFGQPQVGGGGE